MFSDKDFFGDPMWPSDYHPDKQKNQNQMNNHQYHQITINKLFQTSDKQDDSQSRELLDHLKKDIGLEEIDFFVHQQKLTYSAFKNAEITYLDEIHRGGLFGKEDEHDFSHEESDQIFKDEESLNQDCSNLVKLQEEEEELFHSYSENQQSDELNSYPVSNLIQDRLHTIKIKKSIKPRKIYRGKSITMRKRRGNTENPCKQENQIIEELFDENCLIDNDQKRQKMIKIQREILRKLKYSREQHQNPSQKSKKSKQISTKYKILSQAEKQYLVHLSTKTTSCEVARRFNVSVNNICRWKKGCVRKIGAGRKITNQQLQQKVIEFVKSEVKSGAVLTRKLIQQKAKEFSENESFKASKGWFQRFYNRNIDIFTNSPHQNEFLNQ